MKYVSGGGGRTSRRHPELPDAPPANMSEPHVIASAPDRDRKKWEGESMFESRVRGDFQICFACRVGLKDTSIATGGQQGAGAGQAS